MADPASAEAAPAEAAPAAVAPVSIPAAQEDATTSDVIDPRSAGADMMDFMQMHMTSILQPFADHLWHLQGTVDELAKAVEEANAKAGKETERLDETRATLESVRTNLNATDSKLSETCTALDQTNAEKAALQEDYDKTKESFKKFSEQVKEQGRDAKELRTVTLANMDASVQELQTGMKGIQGKMVVMEPNFEKAMADIAELLKWQSSATDELSQTSTLAENNSQSLKQQEETQERKRLEDIEIVKNINEHLAQIDESMKNFGSNLEAQGQKLDANDAETKSLREVTDKQGESLKNLEDKTQQLEKDVKDLLDRVAKIDGEIHTENAKEEEKEVKEEDPNAGKRNIYDIVMDLENVVKKNTQNISALSTSERTQDYWIETAKKQIDGLQSRSSNISEQMESTGTKVEDLFAKHGETTDNFGQHKAHIDNTMTSLQKTIDELNEARSDIQGLSKKLAATDGQVLKNKQELDRVDDYFNGMRKGFQASIPQHVQKIDRDSNGYTMGKPVKLPALTPR